MDGRSSLDWRYQDGGFVRELAFLETVVGVARTIGTLPLAKPPDPDAIAWLRKRRDRGLIRTVKGEGIRYYFT